MGMTATQQRNAVSEGMALGLVALGRDRIRFVKLTVDLAFKHAWRDWPHRGGFTQVATDLSKGLDEVHVMTRATKGKHTACFYWTTGRELVVHWRQHDFDPASEDDLAWATEVLDGDVPLIGWKTLAQNFLDRYERNAQPS